MWRRALRYFLTFGIKKWIYLHSRLSAWLQQRSTELTSIVGGVYTVITTVMFTADGQWAKLQRRGEKKRENWSLWWVLNWVRVDVNLNTYTQPLRVLFLAKISLWQVYNKVIWLSTNDPAAKQALLMVNTPLLIQIDLKWLRHKCSQTRISFKVWFAFSLVRWLPCPGCNDNYQMKPLLTWVNL